MRQWLLQVDLFREISWSSAKPASLSIRLVLNLDPELAEIPSDNLFRSPDILTKEENVAYKFQCLWTILSPLWRTLPWCRSKASYRTFEGVIGSSSFLLSLSICSSTRFCRRSTFVRVAFCTSWTRQTLERITYSLTVGLLTSSHFYLELFNCCQCSSFCF